MKVVLAPRCGTGVVTFARAEVLVENRAVEAGKRVWEKRKCDTADSGALERQRQQG